MTLKKISSRLAICSANCSIIEDDIKAGTKLPDGTLKKISEAKTLTGERKFKEPFEFKCLAFPILLCNNIPSLADLSYGMMRRLRVVPFARIFKEHETDRQLFERIAANELSGVLNRALAGWKRLQTMGRFTRSVDMVKARKQLVAHANPLQGFIDECCEKAQNVTIKLDEFYRRYKAWAEDNGYHDDADQTNGAKKSRTYELSDTSSRFGPRDRRPENSTLKLREAEFSLKQPTLSTLTTPACS